MQSNHVEYEVVWSGGPLLPARNEGMSPMWRNMLSETEAGLMARVFGAAERMEDGGTIRTGRLCACGCGQEMVYSAQTDAKYRNAIYKTGHQHRRKDLPPRQCETTDCGKSFVPGSVYTRYCSKVCQYKTQRERQRGRRAA